MSCAPEPAGGAAPLLSLYRAMLRIRRIEEAIARLYGGGEMRCPVHLCLGQEAVPAGVSAHLRPDDLVFSGHRSHGHYLAKGGDLKAMMAELFGRETGCAHGRGGSQHLIDLAAGFVAAAPILAGTVPIAVGAALGYRRRGEDRVVAVYFGDGATEEGVFHEALNFAAVHRLNVVFVCENNLYSVHSGLSVRQPAGRTLIDLARGHGIPGMAADGNDVEAVWRTAGAALGTMRRDGGPVLLEYATYRLVEHCGPNEDPQLPYRSPAEVAAWRARCPVQHARTALRRLGRFDDAEDAGFEAALAAEIDATVSDARAGAFPAPDTAGRFTLPEPVAG